MKKHLKKINIILAAVNAVILIAFAAVCVRVSSLEKEFGSANAKKAWDSKDTEYSQISLFFRHGSGLDPDGIYQLRSSVEQELKSADSEIENNGRLWIDCAASDSTTLKLEASMGSCTAAVSGTFGDYFIFHPEKLLYGSYYTNEDTNADRIVIDKVCSWQLFGSVETTGLPVRVGNRVMYVAAVVDTPDDKTAKTAYGELPRIYMPYETLKGFDENISLTAYEACIPEIMKDFAYNLIKDANPVSGSDSIITDQTGRFKIINLFKGFGKIPENIMVTSGISFPWYENAARSGEIRAQMITGPAVYPLLITAISLVYMIFMLTRLGEATIKRIRAFIEKKAQKRISEKYYKKHSKKD